MHNTRVFLNRVCPQGLHVRFIVFTSVSPCKRRRLWRSTRCLSRQMWLRFQVVSRCVLSTRHVQLACLLSFPESDDVPLTSLLPRCYFRWSTVSSLSWKVQPMDRQSLPVWLPLLVKSPTLACPPPVFGSKSTRLVQ